VNSSSAFGQWMASNGLLPNSMANNFNATEAVEFQKQQQEQLQQAQRWLQQAMAAAQFNTSSSGPNYAKIYSFLGQLFENKDGDHIESFSELSPLDKETVQLLMQNLATNITSPEFKEQHALLMQQYSSLQGKKLPTPTPTQTVQIVDSHKEPMSMDAIGVPIQSQPDELGEEDEEIGDEDDELEIDGEEDEDYEDDAMDE